MRRRSNPSNVVPLIVLGGGVGVFFLAGKANQLGPLQGIYNAVVNPTNVSVSATPAAGGGTSATVTATPTTSGGSSPNYAFISGYQYVGAYGNGWVVVTKGVQHPTIYDNEQQAENAYNAAIASGT